MPPRPGAVDRTVDGPTESAKSASPPGTRSFSLATYWRYEFDGFGVDGSETLPAFPKTLRTVSTSVRRRSAAEMHTIGPLRPAILAILLLSGLPFAVVLWAVRQVGRAVRSFVGGDEDTSETSTSRRGRPDPYATGYLTRVSTSSNG